MAFPKTKAVMLLLVLLIILQGTLAVTKTFRAQETDYVKINATAIDPDNDKVIYYYSSPLDENGEWQTNYGDAGEYLIEITASDGITQANSEILLIVDKKNQPPAVIKNKITAQETQVIDLKELVYDLDGDPLSYVFNAPVDKSGLWKTNYDDEGVYIANFKVSDGEFEINVRAEIEILNTNQPPSIINSFSETKKVNVKENQTLNYFINVSNEDTEALTYVWKFDGAAIGGEKQGEYYFDFDESGEHFLKVSVSDGTTEINQEWYIRVENVNRKPDVSILPVTATEGGKIILNLPETDLDGDALKYSFDKKFNGEGEWQTGFQDAGTYVVDVSASDGELTTTAAVKVVVNDVDRAPVLNVPEQLEAKEGEKFSWVVAAADPDGDNFTVAFESLPEGAVFDVKAKSLSWTPGYDYIHRKGGFLSNVLNALRLENKFIEIKPFTLGVAVCSKELCAAKSVPVTVYNVNRKPLLEKISNITVTEMETAILSPIATDSDGDIVRVTFSEPFNSKGEWKTGYDDEGKHLVYVAATDGELTTTVPIEVNVVKKNRAPTVLVKKGRYVINEGQELTFSVAAADLDQDELSIQLENLPSGASFDDNVFSWKPGFDIVNSSSSSWADWLVNKVDDLNRLVNENEEAIRLDFTASDGEYKVVHPVTVTVKNLNQQPEIIDYLPVKMVTAKVGESVVFHVAARDEDNLNYKWHFGLREKSITGTDTVERTFVSPGEKKIKVTVSDGIAEVEKEWAVNVLTEEGALEGAVEEEIVNEQPVPESESVLEEEQEEPAVQEEPELPDEQASSPSAKFNVYVIRW